MGTNPKLRHEYKFYINEFDKTALIHRLSYIMKRDSFASANGSYRVRSLYFDNCYDKALREKIDGISRRDKLRIRYYNSDLSFIRFEMKSKNNGLCLKRGFTISKEDCDKVISGDYSCLKNGNSTSMEFYSMIQTQILRPRVIVDYSREAFTYAPGNVRVTFDYDIRRSASTDKFLDPDYVLSPVSRDIILEIKYDEFLPQLIRDAVQLKYRINTAYSKYASSRLFD